MLKCIQISWPNLGTYAMIIRIFSSLHTMHGTGPPGPAAGPPYTTGPICVIYNNLTASQHPCRYTNEQRTLVPIEVAYFAWQWKELKSHPHPQQVSFTMALDRIHLAQRVQHWLCVRSVGMKKYRGEVHGAQGIREKAICNSLKVVTRRQEINGREIVFNWNCREQGIPMVRNLNVSHLTPKN